MWSVGDGVAVPCQLSSTSCYVPTVLLPLVNDFDQIPSLWVLLLEDCDMGGAYCLGLARSNNMNGLPWLALGE